METPDRGGKVMIPYTDAHTHNDPGSDGVIACVNLDMENPPENPLPCSSMGIHPAQSLNGDFDALGAFLMKYSCKAVGECGMDRTVPVPMERQEKLFLKHAALAQELDLPLIIHCVRAYDRICACASRFTRKRPWILHGFRGREEIASELLKHGFLLSLAPQFVLHSPDCARRFKGRRFLLETDGQDVRIGELYRKFSADAEMEEEEELKEKTFQIFQEAFS